MGDRLRLLPGDFVEAWGFLTGGTPPAEFREVYGQLADAFYFGGQGREPADVRPNSHHEVHDVYANWTLFPLKEEVDAHLADISSAIQRWAKRRYGTRRPRPQDPHRGAVAGAGGTTARDGGGGEA